MSKETEKVSKPRQTWRRSVEAEARATKLTCHSRCGTIKIPPCSKDISASIGLNFAALHRQWWRLTPDNQPKNQILSHWLFRKVYLNFISYAESSWSVLYSYASACPGGCFLARYTYCTSSSFWYFPKSDQMIMYMLQVVMLSTY
jgi:hypothetical protein